MGLTRLILEVAPGETFFPNVRKRFVCHMNPEQIEDGTSANYSDVLPPGAELALSQYVSSDDSEIKLPIFLNEVGAHYSDLNPVAGHMTVKDSLEWLRLVQRPIFIANSQSRRSVPPVLLLIFGTNPVQKVLARNFNFTITMADPVTAAPLRAEGMLSLKKYRKIRL